MASWTVAIFSAASSGISTLKASSNAMTSSTVSRLSAPRSSMNDASGVTLASSTPRCSTTICLIFAATSVIGSATPELLYRKWLYVRFLFATGALSRCTKRARARRGPGRLAWFPANGKGQQNVVPGLDHRHPAIHVQCGASDPPGLIRGEIGNGGGNVSGLTQPLQRNRLRQPGALHLAQRIGHRGHDEAGGDDIDGDPARGDFLRQGFGHADHAGLGGGIVGLAGVAGGTDDGGNVDD